MSLAEAFGRVLKQKREALKLSQEELGKVHLEEQKINLQHNHYFDDNVNFPQLTSQ